MDDLVSTEWLAEQLGADDLVAVDCSWFMPSSGRDGRAEFLAGHIPGARYLDIDSVAAPMARSERESKQRRTESFETAQLAAISSSLRSGAGPPPKGSTSRSALRILARRAPASVKGTPYSSAAWGRKCNIAAIIAPTGLRKCESSSLRASAWGGGSPQG